MRRLLNAAAAIAVGLTMAALALLLYEFTHTAPRIVSSSITARSASELPQMYENWRNLRSEQTFPGFTADPYTEADDPVFLEATVRLKKEGFLPAEWVALEAEPIEGDLMIMPDARPSVLNAGTQGELTARILCTREVKDSERKLKLSYYILGRKMAMNLIMDGTSVELEGSR